MQFSLLVFLASLIAFISIGCAIIAFAPTYVASLAITDSLFTSLRQSLLQRASDRVGSYFYPAVEIVQHFKALINTSTLMPWAINTPSMLAMMCEVLDRDVTGVAQVVWFAIPFMNQTFICDRRTGFLVSGYALSAAGPIVAFNNIPGTYKANFSSINTAFPYSPFALSNTYEPLVRARMLPEGQSWIDKALAGLSMQLTAAYPFTDGVGQPAVFAVDALPTSMTHFLSTELGLSPNSKALLLHETSRVVIGNSWGAPVEFRNSTPYLNTGMATYLIFLLPMAMRTQFRSIGNYSEPLVDGMVTYFGGEANLYTCSTPLVATSGAGLDAVYYSVSRVTDPFGLKLRLVMAIPASDYVARLYHDANVVYGTVSGVTVFLILVGIAVSVGISMTLANLSDHMQQAVQFQDDGPEESLSVFSEIAALQSAFRTMKGHLNTMKAYLPQSVLAALLADDDEVDDEGNVHETMSNATGTSADKAHHDKAHHDEQSTSHAGDSRKQSVARRQSAAGNDTMSLRSAGRKEARTLNMTTTVSLRNVACAYFNVHGWNRLAREIDMNALVKLQQLYLKRIFQHSQLEKGVVDFFSGDRVMVTFNAVSVCAGASKRAALCAHGVMADAKKSLSADLKAPLELSVGLGAGPAVCGNVGTDEMKRFNVIGAAYSDAVRLQVQAQRLARELSGAYSSILLPQKMFPEVSHEFYLQTLGVVSCDGSGSGATRVVFASLEDRKSAADDEWMYQLEKGEANDPFAAANEGFALLLGGKEPLTQSAIEALAAATNAADGKSVSTPGMIKLRAALAEIGTGTDAVAKAKNWCPA